MPEALVEKRATRRFNVQLPILLKNNGSSVALFTRDVSSRGISFRSELPLSEGNPINFIMTLTADITQTEPISMRCAGRVVRIERDGSHTISVAAVIERYEFLGQS